MAGLEDDRTLVGLDDGKHGANSDSDEGMDKHDRKDTPSGDLPLSDLDKPKGGLYSDEEESTDADAEAQRLAALQHAPDGGLQAWLTVAGAFAGAFAQFGLCNAFGVFQDYYQTNVLKGYSSDAISWIGSIQNFILFFGGIFTGPLFDAYGAHVLLIPGSIGFVLSLMLTSLCTQYYQFMLAQGILFGLASMLIYNPVVSVPSQWFYHRRALATAIATSASGLGGTLWPIILQNLISSVGFPWAIRIAGFISLALLAISCALIRTRLPRKRPTPLKYLLRPLRELPFALFVAGMGLTTWGLWTPMFYVTTNATRLGASASLGFYIVSCLNAGTTTGRLASSVADKLGRYNVQAVCTCMCGVLLLAFWIPLNTVRALIGFAVVYGFFAGAVVALMPPCIAQITPMHEIGSRVGILYAFVGVSVLCGAPVTGALISKYPGADGYRYAGAFSGACVLGGAALTVAARITIQRRVKAVV